MEQEPLTKKEAATEEKSQVQANFSENKKSEIVATITHEKEGEQTQTIDKEAHSNEVGIKSLETDPKMDLEETIQQPNKKMKKQKQE